MLAADAFRASPHLRTIRSIAFFVPFVLAAGLARAFPPGKDLALSLGVTLPSALLLSALIWALFGRPRLVAEIERMKIADQLPRPIPLRRNG